MVFSQILAHSEDHNQARIRKLFGDGLDFEDIKLTAKTNDIHKIEKNNSINISFFGYENNVKYSLYVSKKKKRFEEEYVDLLLIGEEVRRYYVLIKDFNTFMYDHTTPPGRKYFCRYCLKAFKCRKNIKMSY